MNGSAPAPFLLGSGAETSAVIDALAASYRPTPAPARVRHPNGMGPFFAKLTIFMVLPMAFCCWVCVGYVTGHPRFGRQSDPIVLPTLPLSAAPTCILDGSCAPDKPSYRASPARDQDVAA